MPDSKIGLLSQKHLHLVINHQVASNHLSKANSALQPDSLDLISITFHDYQGHRKTDDQLHELRSLRTHIYCSHCS